MRIEPSIHQVVTTPANPLDPRIIRLWRIRTWVGGVLVAAVGVVAGLLAWRFGSAAVVALVAACTLAVVTATAVAGALIPPRRHRVHRWSVDGDGVVVRSGWLWRETTIVPHGRIQAVDAQSGPLERALGLASVHIRTASVSGSPRIPGLDVRDAEELAALIAERAGVEDAT